MSESPQKRIKIQKKKCILLDIEGTTTSIDFVYEKLFPFARSECGNFLSKNFDDEKVKKIISDFAQLARDDKKTEEFNDIPQLVSLKENETAVTGITDETAVTGKTDETANKKDIIDETVMIINYCMDRDRKISPLKTLQGLIWESGYQSGALKGHIYEDVQAAMEEWKKNLINIYIYSSGSVLAQQLLFGHTEAGDLMPLIDGYFDTSTGPKIDSESYKKICQKIDVKPEEVIFVTDSLKEAEAAEKASILTLLSIRPGNAPIPKNINFDTIYTFSQIQID
eukprot:GHVL01007276.1.p1 GENE.GHVL01007276.1~~GHVL01007276.1.p1  ORF type:complete len:303 (-),score=79.10 GHVL01007276.1:184-1029(-)